MRTKKAGPCDPARMKKIKFLPLWRRRRILFLLVLFLLCFLFLYSLFILVLLIRLILIGLQLLILIRIFVMDIAGIAPISRYVFIRTLSRRRVVPHPILVVLRCRIFRRRRIRIRFVWI